MNRWLLLACAASLGLSACSKNEGSAASGTPGAPSAAPLQAPNSGKILQLEQAGGYTYAEVATGSGPPVWIAGAHIDAKVGDTVQWGRYDVMRNFNAKSLGRVFDQILFVSVWGPVGGSVAEVAPHGTPAGAHPPLAGGAAAGQPAAAVGTNRGKVKSVAAAGGYTYLEVLQGSDAVWIAVPETPVKAGDTVAWDNGMVMQNFNAKSLNRVFERIVFAGGVTVVP